jgi:hypothetical protein
MSALRQELLIRTSRIQEPTANDHSATGSPPDRVPYFVRKIGTEGINNEPGRMAKLRYPRNKS